jgi:hypothetical protein
VFSVDESNVVSFDQLLQEDALIALRALHDRRLGENERNALGYKLLLDDLKSDYVYAGVIKESAVGMHRCGPTRERRSLSADENVTETDAIAILADVAGGSPMMVGC